MATTTTKDEAHKPIFVDLNPDNPEENITEVESLCPNCEQQGVTRLMLTQIPFFQEVILSSFHCDHCGCDNRHVQHCGKIQEKGVKYDVVIKNNRDLNRQVVKSEFAIFSIPHLDFEQPATGRGEITSLEGLIDGIIRGLNQEQPLRKTLNPELYEKLEEFIKKLENLKTLKETFNIVIDDPSGNSFVENPAAPHKDESLSVTHYVRTHDQDVLLGLKAEDDREDNKPGDSVVDDDSESHNESAMTSDHEETEEKDDLKDEVLSIPTNCPSCNAPCDTNMKIVNIPFFKEVVIMATTCDVCGNRESEVKGGSGIEDKGKKITLKVTHPSDLNRDVLKSDTCAVFIPELDLELVEGTLGGRFTTVEGLLMKIKDQLKNNNPFFLGDGAPEDTRVNMETFLQKLDALITGAVSEFTLILDDPAGNSYLQNLCAPYPDPQMIVEQYTRNDEQNDRLGLLDMKTENYAENDC